MEKVEEFYVIEMANSREDMPDFLSFEDGIIQWFGINMRVGNPHAQKEIAIHKATQFKTEKEAKKFLKDNFGAKYQARITRHFRYI